MQSGKNDDGYYDVVAIVAILRSFKTASVWSMFKDQFQLL